MRFLRRLLPLLALATLGGNVTPPDDLDELVMQQMENRHINGLSLAILQDGRIMARAYGVTDKGEPRRVDTTTLFQAGSISKPVSALGALRLVEQHKLDLESDVNARLRSWHLPTSSFTASKPVTLRGLLSHTAGLTVHGFPGYDVDSVKPTLVQVLDAAPPANTAAIRSYIAPGTVYEYSGGGYTIMQQLMIDVTGQSFPAYMQKAVLTPLGMGRSSFEQPLPAKLAANTAAGYYSDGSKVHGRWHVYPEMAAAGLWTTASDLVRFATGIQAAYLAKAGALISQSTARDMLTVQKGAYALGLGITGNGEAMIFGHNGRDEGFDALLSATASTGQAYAIMINANDNSRASARIGAFIAKKYGWPGNTSYAPPAAVAITSAELESATGIYDVGSGQFLTFVVRDGRLYTSRDGGIDEPYIAQGNDLFASAERPVRMKLLRDSSGMVTGMTPGARVLPRIGPLFRAVRSAPLSALAAARADTVLRALSSGGIQAKESSAVTPGALKDFGAAPWQPVAGLRGVQYAGMSEVRGTMVERHGSQVARVGYFRAATATGTRLILVYFTKDDLITDVDVIDE